MKVMKKYVAINDGLAIKRQGDTWESRNDIFDMDLIGECPCCPNKIIYKAGEKVPLAGDKLCKKCVTPHIQISKKEYDKIIG